MIELIHTSAESRRADQAQPKPPLKWAGGKRWLLPHVLPIWQKHSHRRLVEPFCGGLAIALGLSPLQALLNDINPHAIHFYRWLKRGLIAQTDFRNEEYCYYNYRNLFNESIQCDRAQSKQSAELFYYLNRTGYNGLCRFNKRGLFNVPFGQYKHINYTTDFSEYKTVFSAWDFDIGDFELLSLAPSDFVYADPPYDVEFTQYAKEGFKWADQVRLAKWLARHRGPVLASNQATDRIVELYDSLGFEIEILEAPRMISCTGDRSKANEILARKNLKK